MDKEKYNRIIDEVYDLYADSHVIPPKNPNGKLLFDQLFSVIPMEHSKETFVIECKKNPKFSKKWGLKIEEMKLSEEERIDLIQPFGMDALKHEARNQWMKDNNIPTKKITVLYEDEIIEFYE